ncbi:MAG: DNA polymerase IV [Archangium gephyra]|uniref:DNA polymerase IV n=1 Tax=Archangium gephyra TaxID=48 RepID=A0A2W5TQ88_9BACT|nr:MAG: DNA polymerase IV [Archangium gephyra]
MSRAIIHIDMDAFYAAVEQRDAPALRGKPVIVGGHPQRGVVLAASYEVRPFGVRSAIPMARAIKLAPHAIVVPPRFAAYVDASEQVFRIFERYTPQIEPLSLDEAFLDVSASRALFGSAGQLAKRIRDEIRREIELPASAGIADVKFVAKIASDVAKPNGQHEVPEGTSRAFLAPLPISRLWGVGPKTEEVLKRFGLHTIGDVAAKDLEWLGAKLGTSAQHFWELSHGIDSRPVVSDREAKSVGAQDTFDEDLLGEEALKPHLHSQALRVGRRLRKSGVKARCVQLTVKYADFTQITRRQTLELPTDDGQTLYRKAIELLQKADLRRRVRLTGVSGQELTGGAPQLGLFVEDAAPPKNTRLNAALDAIASKFGNKAVVTADLREDDPDEARDGFYSEDKRETAARAEKERAQLGLRVERDD